MKSILKWLGHKENTTALLVALVLVQPIIDIDWVLYPFLDKFGIPLLSTVVYFIFTPLIIGLAFLVFEDQKKKALIFGSLFGGVVFSYFLIHNALTEGMFDLLYLSNRYVYSTATELRYVITLIVPLGLVYAFFKSKINRVIFDKIVVISSILISFPIFISNLFLFGPATYYNGPTLANFPTWFFGIYNDLAPKQLATKFYFSEGNTTGIILFSLYPLLINAFYKSKHKWKYFLLIFVQGWAMLILGTRVATYGAPLMLGISFSIWLILALLHKVEFDLKKHVLIVLLGLMFFVSLPYTPAVVNIGIDVRNNSAVWEDEYLRQQWKSELENDPNAQDLIPGTAEFDYYYQHIFRQYYWLLTLSDAYYKEYYPYLMDAKFYVDYIFNVDFYDRINARQFEKYFFDYKWEKLNTTQRMFGFGYSRFMMGSILLEQDFIMQTYTLGYVGMILLTGPWIVLAFWIIYKSLRNFRHIYNPDYLTLGIAFFSILGGAYLSGHVLDQFFSSTFLALYCAMLLGYQTHWFKK